MSRHHRSGTRKGAIAMLVLVAVWLMPGAPAASMAAASRQSGADWTMYHANPARTGFLAGLPDPRRLTTLWTARLDGAVYAEPLVVAHHVLVATENDSIYALDARTGRVQWRLSAGSPVPRSALPCGNIDPLGITGTPVYDPRAGLVYVVAEVAGPAHVLLGVDVATGRLKVRRAVDPPGADPSALQQRGALAFAGARVYIPFGGLWGDCGAYHGWIVASRADGTGGMMTYQVPTAREGGIWATPGPVIDARGNLYVTVGNGAATQGAWDHSDAVLRLSPDLRLQDAFAPSSWAADNAADLDLGSMGPVLLPNGLLYANGKTGQGYLLRARALGGIGGGIQTVGGCTAFGGAAVRGSSFFVPCDEGVQQLTVTAAGRLVKGWRQPVAAGSPVVGGQTVYTLNPGAGMLYALDAATGRLRASLGVGATSRFATPTLFERTVLVGTLTGIVAAAIR
ncbi:MAG: hypothetical protein NVSMB65_10240 [Chloroflexota bacterium]